MTQDQLYLKKLETDLQWENYHRIRKTELFTDRKDGVEYDLNHPTLTNINHMHYLFYKNSDAIGTIQIEYLDNITVAFRIIAIDGNLKNKGYGTKLLIMAENIIKKLGYKKIVLHANPKAYNFYKKNGYTEMEFLENKLNPDSIDMGKILK